MFELDFAPNVQVEPLQLVNIIQLKQTDLSTEQDVTISTSQLKHGQITFVSNYGQSTLLNEEPQIRIISIGDTRYLSLPKTSQALAIIIPGETPNCKPTEESPNHQRWQPKQVKPSHPKRPPLSIILPRLLKKAVKSKGKARQTQKLNASNQKARQVKKHSVSDDGPLESTEPIEHVTKPIDKPYVCEKCPKSFASKHLLKTHQILIHKEKLYPCENCPEKFLYRRELQKHEKTHPEAFRLTCKTCGKLCSGKASLKTHQLVHAPEEYLCDRCPRLFKNKSALTRHLQNHEKDLTKVLEGGKILPVSKSAMDLSCPVCSKQFKGNHALVNHQRGVHDIDIARGNTFTCEHCGLGYETKKGLKDHIRSNHADGKQLMCNVCGKRFSKKELLKQHTRIHTGERPYSCDDCGKTFSLYSGFYKHKKIHTGEKPYACEYCTKKFACRTYLNVHLRLHTGHNPFKCEYCEKGYPQKVQLKLHMKSHHPDKPIDL